MKLSEQAVGEVTILRVSGQLMGAGESDRLRERLLALAAEGSRKCLVDMSEVTWVNSTGLGILISGHLAIQRSGGSMRLFKVTKRIESILAVTRLTTVFEIFATEAEAMRGLAAPAREGPR